MAVYSKAEHSPTTKRERTYLEEAEPETVEE